MTGMHQSSLDPSPSSGLSESEYEHLRTELALQLKKELRRAGRQNMFVMGFQALIMIFLAVLLFFSARHYHDMMLWGIGLCLLLFSLMEFLDLDFVSSGHSWLDLGHFKNSAE